MKTGSWKTYKGAGRIGVARQAPRFAPAGFKLYRALAPGPWFNEPMTEGEYERRYRSEVLDRLDPQAVWDQLHALALPPGAEPVLMCFEAPPWTSDNWCHRRMIAAWFKETLGQEVPEIAV